MFEKKIKKFFNSVAICGELPTQEKMDKRILAMIEITAGVACAMIGALIVMCLMDKVGEEIPDENDEE